MKEPTSKTVVRTSRSDRSAAESLCLEVTPAMSAAVEFHNRYGYVEAGDGIGFLNGSSVRPITHFEQLPTANVRLSNVFAS